MLDFYVLMLSFLTLKCTAVIKPHSKKHWAELLRKELYKYTKMIFGTPKIKLQKGVQYGTFKEFQADLFLIFPSWES